MPDINLLILLTFHFSRILECTFFCAIAPNFCEGVHFFLCKKTAVTSGRYPNNLQHQLGWQRQRFGRE